MSRTHSWKQASWLGSLAVAVVLLGPSRSPTETLAPEARTIADWLEEAAADFDVPVELLQAVAFVESRWRHLTPTIPKALAGARPADPSRPPSYGVMGLRDDDHFGHSLREAAELLSVDPEQLRTDARLNIRGAAALLSKHGRGRGRAAPLEEWEEAVARLSGIPQRSIAQIHTYDVFNAIKLGRQSERYRVDRREVDMGAIYGGVRLQELSRPTLSINVAGPSVRRGVDQESADYPPAGWIPAASCNYNVGRASAITHVAIHIMDGTYAGTISWFQDCRAQVSAHYVVRSSDGQVTQMVRENDTAWHVASHNSYSVGIEHEGFADNPAWYTQAQYVASKDLVRDIAASHGIDRDGVYDACSGWDTELPRSGRWRIKGHTNFPASRPCPGVYWDWWHYRNLVLNNCSTIGAIDQKWREMGGQCGFLRACTTNELPTPDGVGRFNHFQGGSIYWTAQTGAHTIYGAIRDKWASLGWEGFNGYPTTDETGTPDGVGRFNHFSGFGGHASIYWTPTTGAHEVHGAIHDRWAQMGWERSCLGYPVSDEYASGSGRRSDFQNGYIFWTPTAGAIASCGG